MYFIVRCVSTALVIECGVAYATVARPDVPYLPDGLYAMAWLNFAVAGALWVVRRGFYVARALRVAEANKRAPVARFTYVDGSKRPVAVKNERPLLDDSLGRF